MANLAAPQSHRHPGVRRLLQDRPGGQAAAAGGHQHGSLPGEQHGDPTQLPPRPCRPVALAPEDDEGRQGETQDRHHLWSLAARGVRARLDLAWDSLAPAQS